MFPLADSQVIQRQVPGSRLIRVPQANHIIVVNNPEAVARVLLDFLRDNRLFAGIAAETRPVDVATPADPRAS